MLHHTLSWHVALHSMQHSVQRAPLFQCRAQSFTGQVKSASGSATSSTSGWPAPAARWRAASWQLPAGREDFSEKIFSGQSTAATPRLCREQDVIGMRSGSFAAGADCCWFECEFPTRLRKGSARNPSRCSTITSRRWEARDLLGWTRQIQQRWTCSLAYRSGVEPPLPRLYTAGPVCSSCFSVTSRCMVFSAPVSLASGCGVCC